MRRARRVIVVTMFIAPLVCLAQEGDEFGQSLNLGGAAAYARRHNPEIRAAEARWRAAQARPSQAGSLADPMINTAYHNESFDRLEQGRGDFTFLRFGAEQEVPFPGKLALKEKVASREADREGARYRTALLNVLARLRIAYDDYSLAHKSIEIVGRNKDLLDKLARAAEARYQVGDGLQQDVVRAQLELSILNGRLTSLEQARQSAAALLNALLNRPAGEPLGVPAPVEKRPLAYSLDRLETLAQQQSPGLRAAEFDVARAEGNLALAKRQYFPDFVLRADYFNKASLTPEWEVGAGIRVPLYFWRKQAYGVREAAAALSEAQASRQFASQDIMATIRDAYAQATSAERLVQLYGTVVGPQAEIALESASAAYQVGKVDFLSVLANFTTLNDYRLRYYEELANFDKAVARVEAAAGVLPDEQPGRERP
ncbi:MAG: TolC family protein [Candidatus Binatia bacterium]